MRRQLGALPSNCLPVANMVPTGVGGVVPRSKSRLRESVGSLARRGDYPPTNGSAGGKHPAGKAALRSPAFSFSAACRKAATNQA